MERSLYKFYGDNVSKFIPTKFNDICDALVSFVQFKKREKHP